jgi:hypothetical protein
MTLTDICLRNFILVCYANIVDFKYSWLLKIYKVTPNTELANTEPLLLGKIQEVPVSR